MARADVVHAEVFVTRAWGGQPVRVVLHEDAPDADPGTAAAADRVADTAIVDPRGSGDSLLLRALRGTQEQPFSINAALAAARVLHARGVTPAGRALRLSMPLADAEVTLPAADADVEVPLWVRSPTISLGGAWSSPQVLALLGLGPEAGLAGLPVQLTTLAQPTLLVPVVDLAALSACRLDAAAFRGYAVRQVRHQALRMVVYAFCPQPRSDEDDLAARLFRPGNDAPADAASGDAAACLGAYLMQHGRLPADGEVRIEQGHDTGRPSLLRVRGTPAGIEVGGAVRLQPTADPTSAP